MCRNLKLPQLRSSQIGDFRCVFVLRFARPEMRAKRSRFALRSAV
jgi:hypothetical protein